MKKANPTTISEVRHFIRTLLRGRNYSAIQPGAYGSSGQSVGTVTAPSIGTYNWPSVGVTNSVPTWNNTNPPVR